MWNWKWEEKLDMATGKDFSIDGDFPVLHYDQTQL